MDNAPHNNYHTPENTATIYCVNCKDIILCPHDNDNESAAMNCPKFISIENLLSDTMLQYLRYYQKESKLDQGCQMKQRYCEINRYNNIINIDTKTKFTGAASVTISIQTTSEKIMTIQMGDEWIRTGQFSTKPDLTNPWAIATHPDGRIAVTRHTIGLDYKAMVFTNKGERKFSFKGPFDAHLCDIAITPDKKIIFPGKGEILVYDEQGNLLKNAKISINDMENRPCNIWSLAVDSRGRIVAGWIKNTISIHKSCGQLISKITLLATPDWLAVTPNGTIVASLGEKQVQLMDYSGNNVRVLQPPQGVRIWKPYGVCCSKIGEIFVVNIGEPKAVYQYIEDRRECLGCVIEGLDNPRGIALSKDGQELLVVEWKQHMVKIFHRHLSACNSTYERRTVE